MTHKQAQENNFQIFRFFYLDNSVIHISIYLYIYSAYIPSIYICIKYIYNLKKTGTDIRFTLKL